MFLPCVLYLRWIILWRLHFSNNDDDGCSDSGLRAPNSNSLQWTNHGWWHTWSKIVSWEVEHHWMVIRFQHNIFFRFFCPFSCIWKILKATSRLINENINSIQNVLALILCEYIKIGRCKQQCHRTTRWSLTVGFWQCLITVSYTHLTLPTILRV